MGYDDLVVAVISGGVTETLKPREIEPVGSTYRVARRIEASETCGS